MLFDAGVAAETLSLLELYDHVGDVLERAGQSRAVGPVVLRGIWAIGN